MGRLGSLLRYGFVAVLDALALWAAIWLAASGGYLLLSFLLLGTGGLNVALLSPRAYPLRYLLPGLFFMTMMVVYPIGYTVYVAFTDYGTGHVLTKGQAIDQLESRLYEPASAPRYPFRAFQNEAGELRFLITLPDGDTILSEGDRFEAVPPGDPTLVDTDGDGTVDELAGGYQAVTGLSLMRHLGDLQKRTFSYGESELRLASLTAFAELQHRYRYEPEADRLVDLQTDTVYRPVGGYFTNDQGERLSPGYRSVVGLRNFQQLVTNPRISRPFMRVFVWTFVWALASVASTFIMGLGLALVLNDPRIRMRKLYRSLLILPYAFPAFISALVWRGLLNTEVGLINRVLESVGIAAVPWLTDPFWAKVGVVLVNLWLGFPYMMLITTGALQSIPGELYEAAYCDGATGWQRLRHITLPMLMISVAPLLISSFAFNFNNFNVIYLVTQGRPPIPGAGTPAGATDILISYTYRLAFEGGSGTNYGLASAVAMMIFVLIGLISYVNFRFTGVFEKVGENV
ncbi:maltose ABC transporter permease [Limnochorda pilosa]|uniref:Maltose/maltodextrin transport system permease protein n=2 Tax=Limnochorda pilosa TaxID=1555112 RepID=A0A0K2SIS2_LIMPI|nr:maltose ABC transporter permease [Limnochorda pilosa]